MFEPPVEEDIPMETKNNVDEDYAYQNEAYNNEETTTFTDPTRSSTPYSYDEPTENHPLLSPKPSIENQRRQIKRSKISDLYKHMKWEFDNSAELYLDDKFAIRNEKGRNQLFYIKNGKEYSLTKNNGEFRSQRMINTIINPSEQTILAVSKILDDTPTMIEMQTMTGEQIIETTNALSRDIAINTDLDMREMLDFDALTRFKEELVNNASKLTEIDEQIKGTKDELKNARDPQEQKELKERLKELQQERKTRLEIASHNQKQLSSQIARIRDTLYDFCEDDLSLREKLKNIFREHGLTITAVITAIGTIISTLVLSLTGGNSNGIPGGPPKPNKGKGKEWVKNKLKALARLLGRLANQVAKALPGMLGSLFAAILNLLKKVALLAVNYTWIFLTGIGSVIGYEMYKYFNSSKKKR